MTTRDGHVAATALITLIVPVVPGILRILLLESASTTQSAIAEDQITEREAPIYCALYIQYLVVRENAHHVRQRRRGWRRRSYPNDDEGIVHTHTHTQKVGSTP